MKKLLCLILGVIMMMSTVACSNPKTQEEAEGTGFEAGVLYAGYGRSVITPKGSVPLGGYGAAEQRMSDRVLDDLYATCVAFTDGDQTMLLISADAVRSSQDWTNRVRERIQTELGVPGTNVMIMSSHSHSAPETTSKDPSISAYSNLYVEGCVSAAKAAMEDRSKATMYTSSVQTESMTFVRHYLMNDGTVCGPNFGSAASGFAGHVGRGDEEMILWKLEREDGKKPILLMNFQAHTTFTGGADVKDISADYVGVCRDILEAEEGVLFAYYLGACGNQTPNSYITQENNTMPFADQLPGTDRTYITYGTALALYAKEGLANMTAVDTKAGIVTTSKVVTCPTNKNQPADRVADAQIVVDVWKSQNRDAGNAKARELGFASVYEANGMLGISSLPDSNNIEVCASRIGNMYFVNAPYEMFSENALYIKENTPAGTMVMTQSNHAWGYITDKKAFEYKCYENFGFTFAEGTGELLVEEMVGLINTLG